jgi:hypothetical protein
MKTEIASNTDQGSHHSTAVFLNLLLADGGQEYERDFDSVEACDYLTLQLNLRNGSARGANRTPLPSQFVIRQAASRHFNLLQEAVRSLRNVFTEKEMVIMLNTTCGTVWEWYPGCTVAGMVADDNGINDLDDLPSDSALRTLIVKLCKLSNTENLALVDICESVWRSLGNESLDELCAKLGMSLKQED